MSETITDRIKNNLSILGMKNTFENIDDYLEAAIKNKTSLIDFLDLLLDRESKGKINRSVENQIKMAGFPSRKTFELYDFSFQPQIDLEVMNDLRTLRFVDNAENIVFLGTPGVGKTHFSNRFRHIGYRA